MTEPSEEALKSNLMQFYNSLAPIYDFKYSNPSIDYMRKVERSAISKYTGTRNMKILDLGCGTGSSAIELAGMGHEVVGVDISPDMVSLAQRKASEAGVESFTSFLEGDVQELSNLPSDFGLAVSMFGALNHVMDLQATLTGVVKKLQPGGLLIFSVANRSNRYDIVKARKQGQGELESVWKKIRTEEIGKAVWTRLYDRIEVERAILGSGLRLLRVGGVFYFLKPSYRRIAGVAVRSTTRFGMSVEMLLRWHWPVANQGVYLVFISSRAKV